MRSVASLRDEAPDFAPPESPDVRSRAGSPDLHIFDLPTLLISIQSETYLIAA